MSSAKEARTPLPSAYNPVENTGKVDPELCRHFQSVIRSLLYIMLGTRPDITYVVIKLSQYSANPSKDHLAKALYIVRYLLHTQNYELVFDGSSQEGFLAHCNSDWASDADD